MKHPVINVGAVLTPVPIAYFSPLFLHYFPSCVSATQRYFYAMRKKKQKYTKKRQMGTGTLAKQES